MSRIRVTILDHTGAKKTMVELPTGIPMKRLVPALADRLGLPSSSDGHSISYNLVHNNIRIGDEETLSEVGVMENETLSLLPEISMGGEAKKLPLSEELRKIDEIMNSLANLKNESEQIIKLQSYPGELITETSANMSQLNEQFRILTDQLTTQLAQENASQYGNLLEELRRQQELQEEITEVTAPVEIPTPAQMAVKLVPSHLLTQLEETRTDESQWQSIGWAFVGAILGIITNWVTSDQTSLTRPAIVVLVAFAIMGTLAFTTARRFHQRGQAIRSKMTK